MTSSYNSGPAKLPAIPTVRVQDPAMQRFIDAVRESIEVRAGARGDRFERSITLRDLVQLGLLDPSLSGLAGRGSTPSTKTQGGVLVQTGDKFTAMDFDAFANIILNGKLFKSLTQSLGDPARFDSLPEQVRSILLRDIAAEAAKRGADIRRVEEKIQTSILSSSIAIQEVTASLGASVAGVRETAFAITTANSATAGLVTQIRAALGDPASFTGGGVTLEQAMFGSATTEGLFGQYTMKIDAGGKVAGFGLAVNAPIGAPVESAFIVAADKFAVMGASDTVIDPLNPPLNRVPFGIDTVNNTIYINGNVRIRTGEVDGGPLNEISAGLDGDGVIVEWSVDGLSLWHSTFTLGDEFSRWKVGVAGAWQGPMRTVGEAGAAGVDGGYTDFIFRRAATTPATPVGSTPAGWFDSIPVADGNPAWATTGQKTAAGVLVGVWSPPILIEGTSGINGKRTAVMEVYQWADVAPVLFPSGSSNYTWATGQFSAPPTLNGWSIAPTAAVSGATLWVARQTFADNDVAAVTAISWTASTCSPAGLAGVNGQRIGVLEVYRWANSPPASFPSGTSNYSWAVGQFSAPTTPNGWSITPGASSPGFKLYACAMVVSNTDTSPVTVVTWATASSYVVGAAGLNGIDGGVGDRGSLDIYISGSGPLTSAEADAAVLAQTGSSTKTIGDTVTEYNGTTYVSVLRWNGTAWVAPGVVIDGNMLVNGTITAGKLATNSVVAANINVTNLASMNANLGTVTAGNITGTASISITGSAKVDGGSGLGVVDINSGTTVTSRTSAVLANTSTPYSQDFGVVGYTNQSLGNGAGVYGVGMNGVSGSIGVAGRGRYGVYGTTGFAGGIGVYGSATGSNTGIRGESSTGTGVHGISSSGAGGRFSSLRIDEAAAGGAGAWNLPPANTKPGASSTAAFIPVNVNGAPGHIFWWPD